MSSQLIVRIDEETKKKLFQVSRMEGKTASEKVRELIENYTLKADISGVIDDIWDRAGKKMKERGITEDDIARAVRASRSRR